MKYVMAVVLSLVIVDVIGFTMWALSGQRPEDEYFIGTVTYNTIQWLIYPKN